MALNKAAKMWVKALRSGKYKQGKGMLKSKDGEYCCLGVACDLYRKTFNVQLVMINTQVLRGDCGKVKKWLGLADEAGAMRDMNSLTELNDNTYGGPEFTFSKIADIIESEPKGLFVKKEKKNV